MPYTAFKIFVTIMFSDLDGNYILNFPGVPFFFVFFTKFSKQGTLDILYQVNSNNTSSQTINVILIYRICLINDCLVSEFVHIQCEMGQGFKDELQKALHQLTHHKL